MQVNRPKSRWKKEKEKKKKKKRKKTNKKKKSVETQYTIYRVIQKDCRGFNTLSHKIHLR